MGRLKASNYPKVVNCKLLLKRLILNLAAVMHCWLGLECLLAGSCNKAGTKAIQARHDPLSAQTPAVICLFYVMLILNNC